MKKIIYTIILIVIFQFTSACGYKPIFENKDFNVKIVKHYIEGNKELGETILARLNDLLPIKDNAKDNAKEVNIFIKTKKDKSVTNKSLTGKATEYKITLKAEIKITDSMSNEILLKKNNISLSQKYKVQDQASDTDRLENNAISNLVGKMNRKLIIKILQVGRI